MQITRFGAAPTGKQVNQNATQIGGDRRGHTVPGRRGRHVSLAAPGAHVVAPVTPCLAVI
jgi:hypothetical protein